MEDRSRERVNGRRRFLLKAGGVATAPLLLGPLARAQSMPPLAVPAAGDGQSVVVKTTHGPLRGVRNGGLAIFKGVPYAGSPAGAGRFKAPPKLAPWTGVRDALVYGPQAIQPPDPGWPKEWAPAPSSEDCLVLNVWTPATDGKKRPVMFYSHGGGFATGNGGAEVWPQNMPHDGASLVPDEVYASVDRDLPPGTHRLRLGTSFEIHWDRAALFEKVGCVDCHGTGFRGRQAIIEFMGLNDEIRELLVQRAPTREVKAAARRGGMQFLRESAIEKVRMGITTFAEINKVTFREGA